MAVGGNCLKDEPICPGIMQSVRVDFDEPTNPCVNFYIKEWKKAAAAAAAATGKPRNQQLKMHK